MRAFLLGLLVTVGLVVAAAPASAHPLDETVQQLYVTPAVSGLTVQLDVSPNVLVAPAFAAGVDTDGDRVLDDAETAAHTDLVARSLSVRVDGREVALRPVAQRYPSATLLAAGGGTITLTWVADLPADAQQLVVHDAYAPGPTILTVTHTAAVLALGLVLLAAGRWVGPGVVTPALTAVAGVVVLVLGLRLLWRRRRPTVGHGHGHGRALPGWRGTVAMGFSAGLVPCPEALGVLLLAVGVGRTSLGLGMIVAFSVGLAAVLVGLGVALVVAGPRLTRLDGSGRLVASLPLVSAVVVTVLGLVMAIGGLSGLVR